MNQMREGVRAPLPQNVAVVIHACNAADSIAATVSGAFRIDAVKSVIVVDDASADGTSAVAQQAGASVVRHKRRLGRSASMATGAKVVAVREMVDPKDRTRPVAPAQALLFLESGLGYSAENANPLVAKIMDGSAEIALAVSKVKAKTPGQAGLRRLLQNLTGQRFAEPLANIRCTTRAAWESSLPHGRGLAADAVALIRSHQAGFVAVEVLCEFAGQESAPQGAKNWFALQGETYVLRVKLWNALRIARAEKTLGSEPRGSQPRGSEQLASTTTSSEELSREELSQAKPNRARFGSLKRGGRKPDDGSADKAKLGVANLLD